MTERLYLNKSIRCCENKEYIRIVPTRKHDKWQLTFFSFSSAFCKAVKDLGDYKIRSAANAR